MIEDDDHDGWMDFDGKPVVSRRPPVTIVYAPPGVRLTLEQQSQVSHEFRVFSRIVKTSSIPEGFHTHHAEFADGTRVELRAMQGEFTTEVWPTGGDGPALLYRGFVIKPKFEGGLPSDWGGSTALLTVAGGQWRKWVKPYRPGKASTPIYFVDDIRSRAVRGMQEEQRWFDVYLWTGSSLHINGVQAGTLNGNVQGLFVVLRQPDDVTLPQRVAFTASSDTLYRVAGDLPTPTTLYEYDPFFAPSTGTYLLPARRAPGEDRIDLEVLGKTLAGALQVRRAELTLLRESPWYTSLTSESQLDVPGTLIPSGGYTTSDTYTPTSPMFPLRDANALVCGWLWDSAEPDGPVNTSFNSYIRGTGLGTTSVRSRSTYVKTLPSTDAVAFYEDIVCNIERNAVISSNSESGNVTWQPKWPGPRTWTASSFPGDEAEASLYGLFQAPPAGPDSPSIEANYLVSTAMLEFAGKLEHTDFSTSESALGGNLGVIYSAETQHTVNHIQSESYEYLSDDPGGPRAVSYKFYYVDDDGDGDPDRTVKAPWDAYVPCTKYTTPAIERDERVEVLNVSGSARDYFYVDTENQVYLWLESVLAGTTTTTTIDGVETVDSSATLTCNLKLSTPVGTFSGPPQVFSNVGVTANLLRPADISFGSSDRTWEYVSPDQGMPIFKPLWFDQGACPYIAYTTTAETEAEVAMRLLASFSIQISLAARPIDLELEPIPGASLTEAPMMEQLAQNHFVSAHYASLSGMESNAFTLLASYPGSEVHANIGIDGDDPLSEFYRS